MTEYMSIGELADQAGVSSRTIRYYEELGILPKPPRSEGGTRRYTPEYRFYVAGAVALKELGFALDEIKLVSRLAFGLPMTKRQQRQAEKSIHEMMESLEHRIRVLSRVRDILRERESGAEEHGGRAQDHQHLAAIFESASNDDTAERTA